MQNLLYLSGRYRVYDPEGEIKTWKKNYAGLSAPQRFDLGYDNADQLLTAPLKNANTSALIKQYTYGYDLASNRTSEQVATTTTTSTPNNVNEITSQAGGKVRTLSYDLNGSITSDGGTGTFEWDGANRLVAINYTGFTTRSEFTYDGLSRVAKIVEKTGATINSTRQIVWSGNQMSEFRDATNTVTQRNYSEGQYVGTTAYFYTRDHLGSIREMFTGGGTAVARYDYDPYGRSTTVLGTTPTDFNFTGLYRHSKSGLDLATYRAYDPDLSRWLSRDPIAEEGGLNLYGYVTNGPVRAVDPLGLGAEITVDRGVPSGARTFVAPNGQIFLAPAGANFDNVYNAGKANGTLGINTAVGHFGTFDFQRNEGKGRCPKNTFYPAFTDASNYAVGVYMNGAGYSLNTTMSIAATFASLFSSNAGSSAQRQWWSNGWNAAQSGTPNYPLILLAGPGGG